MARTVNWGGVLAVAVLAILVASPVHAEDYECRGTLGAVTIVGKLLVPDDAVCTLNGTNIQNSIVIKSRATLRASSITVNGGIQGEGPKLVVVTGGTIKNGVQISKSERSGAINIVSANIQGDVQLNENRSDAVIADNVIAGSVQANKNVGGLRIADNRIRNGLQCQENKPPPSGAGNVAKQKQGQCLHL